MSRPISGMPTYYTRELIVAVVVRVVVLLDISLLSLEQLSRFQEHVRLLLEEQLSAVQSFNLIRLV